MWKLKQAKQYLRDYYFIPSDAECYQETDLMLGIRYLNLLADSLNLPLVICFTVGSNMGGHIGTLPLPNLIENYGSLANHIAVIGTGNEADQRHHYANTLTNGYKKRNGRNPRTRNVSDFHGIMDSIFRIHRPYPLYPLPGKTPRESLFMRDQAQSLIFSLSVQRYRSITVSS